MSGRESQRRPTGRALFRYPAKWRKFRFPLSVPATQIWCAHFPKKRPSAGTYPVSEMPESPIRAPPYKEERDAPTTQNRPYIPKKRAGKDRKCTSLLNSPTRNNEGERLQRQKIKCAMRLNGQRRHADTTMRKTNAERREKNKRPKGSSDHVDTLARPKNVYRESDGRGAVVERFRAAQLYPTLTGPKFSRKSLCAASGRGAEGAPFGSRASNDVAGRPPGGQEGVTRKSPLAPTACLFHYFCPRSGRIRPRPVSQFPAESAIDHIRVAAPVPREGGGL